jgi:multidrug transporter EmrE-like cation transporter
MIWFYVSLAAGIFLGIVGQVLLKAGADEGSISAQYLAPQSLFGLLCYSIAAICYMFALRRIPVSVAFPSVSLSYVIIVGLGYWLYDEPIGWAKLVGVGLICGGVFLVARQA